PAAWVLPADPKLAPADLAIGHATHIRAEHFTDGVKDLVHRVEADAADQMDALRHVGFHFHRPFIICLTSRRCLRLRPPGGTILWPRRSSPYNAATHRTLASPPNAAWRVRGRSRPCAHCSKFMPTAAQADSNRFDFVRAALKNAHVSRGLSGWQRSDGECAESLCKGERGARDSDQAAPGWRTRRAQRLDQLARTGVFRPPGLPEIGRILPRPRHWHGTRNAMRSNPEQDRKTCAFQQSVLLPTSPKSRMPNSSGRKILATFPSAPNSLSIFPSAPNSSSIWGRRIP